MRFDAAGAPPERSQSMDGSRPEPGADCRIALGNLWMSLRALFDALPPGAGAARAISYERSVLRAVDPSADAIEQELGRLCNVAREVLRAHRDPAAASERMQAIVRRLEADRASALEALHAGAVSSGVLYAIEDDAAEKASG